MDTDTVDTDIVDRDTVDTDDTDTNIVDTVHTDSDTVDTDTVDTNNDNIQTHLLEPVGNAAIFLRSAESLPILVDTWPVGGEGQPRVMD